MTPEMQLAADAVTDARANFEKAESNLAVARASLTTAEREFHRIWGEMLANRKKYPKRESKPVDGAQP